LIARYWFGGTYDRVSLSRRLGLVEETLEDLPILQVLLHVAVFLVFIVVELEDVLIREHGSFMDLLLRLGNLFFGGQRIHEVDDDDGGDAEMEDGLDVFLQDFQL